MFGLGARCQWLIGLQLGKGKTGLADPCLLAYILLPSLPIIEMDKAERSWTKSSRRGIDLLPWLPVRLTSLKQCQAQFGELGRVRLPHLVRRRRISILNAHDRP